MPRIHGMTKSPEYIAYKNAKGRNGKSMVPSEQRESQTITLIKCERNPAESVLYDAAMEVPILLHNGLHFATNTETHVCVVHKKRKLTPDHVIPVS